MGDISRSGAHSTGVSELFQLLRDGQPRTRAELAGITGLGRSTVASRVDALMSVGLVSAVGDANSTGGRPSSMFALNPGARLALAVDIGASHVNIAITDLVGTELATDSAAIDIAEGPLVVLGWVVEAARGLLDGLGRDRDALIGVGIGVPGPVEHSTGRPINPPIMPGWDRFDVAGWVEQQLDARTLVDNDVNIMALGERAQAWPNVDHLLFIKVATGIGSGIISDGMLQRGAQGIAGDIGHVRIARAADVPCRCGNRGCLEAIASGPAIARQLRERGIDAPDGRAVLELVRGGNVEAIQAVRQAGRDIGEVLTAAVSFINPAVIALGGSMAQAGEHLIVGVREVIYSRSMPLATEHLTIAPSAAGSRAAVIGASVLAIEHALAPENLAVVTG